MSAAFQHDAFQLNAFQIGLLEGFAFQQCAFQYGAFQVDICGEPVTIPLRKTLRNSVVTKTKSTYVVFRATHR